MLIREHTDARSGPPAHPRVVLEREFRTGEALFAFDESLTIRAWNEGAEALTGMAAADALGRPCWEVLAGLDDTGGLVCHRGCSSARLARTGWPVRCHEIAIKTQTGRRRVSLSTIAVSGSGAPVLLHLMRDAPARMPEREHRDRTDLTPRQVQVLDLIAEGLRAKAIASQLGITLATVRNHVHAILVELGAHSQLEAVAEARRRGLLGR